MITHFSGDAWWDSLPVECRASLVRTFPDVGARRIMRRGSTGATDTVVQALFESSPEGLPKQVLGAFPQMGDRLMELLLEPSARPQWARELAGPAMSSEAAAKTFVDWVFAQEGALSKESDLRKAAAFLAYRVPDHLVPEDQVEEFLSRVGSAAAIQQLAMQWPEVSDDFVWDLLVGERADFSSSVLDSEWYTAGGWNHVPVVLSYRKDLYDKALEVPDLVKFCPHSLWWEDSHADALPGIDWEAQTCSPDSNTAEGLLSLAWCPATTPERALMIRDMAKQHSGMSKKWYTTAGAAESRVNQKRPAIDLETESNHTMLEKMHTRVSKAKWPKRFAEAIHLAKNPNFQSFRYGASAALTSQLSYLMVGTELAADPYVQAAVTSVRPANTSLGPAVADRRQRPRELEPRVAQGYWDEVKGLDAAKQSEFWLMLDNLIETENDPVSDYVRTALTLIG